MEAKAHQKHIRLAPRKVRVVADLIRGKSVAQAFDVLAFTQKRAALVVRKALDSAVANARQKGQVDVDTLVVKWITVDAGPTIRRFTPRAMGRATRINKRTAHLSVEIAQRL